MEASGNGRAYVFVHGPHRRGAAYAYQLADVPIYSGKSVTRGRLWQSGPYPALVPDPDAKAPWVEGDIFRVDEDRLRMLDDFHGIPAGSFSGENFRRVRAEVFISRRSAFGMSIWIWEWIGPLEGAVAVSSGNWMDIERSRQPPQLTALALGCLVAAPLALMFALRTKSPELAAISLSAPLVGALANFFAARRRERWPRLRVLFWLLFGVWYLVLWSSVLHLP